MMTPVWISAATCVITICGGLVALRLQAYRGLVLAFCAGALIAGALMDVIPDAMQLLESAHTRWHHHHLMLACSVGFLLFYLVEHAAQHGEELKHAAVRRSPVHQAGALGAAGISVHSFFDGVAIGGAFQAGSEIGWIVALAVLLHKFADGVTTVGIMLGTKHSQYATTTMLSVAAVAPIGGVAAQSAFSVPPAVLALALGWFAGVFLYLGASNLLPAAHEASQSRWLPLATLAGVVFIYMAQQLAE
jgi:zinc and cadmium transporter